VDRVGDCFFFFFCQLNENSQMLTIVRGPGCSTWYWNWLSLPVSDGRGWNRYSLWDFGETKIDGGLAVKIINVLSTRVLRCAYVYLLWTWDLIASLNFCILTISIGKWSMGVPQQRCWSAISIAARKARSRLHFPGGGMTSGSMRNNDLFPIIFKAITSDFISNKFSSMIFRGILDIVGDSVIHVMTIIILWGHINVSASVFESFEHNFPLWNGLWSFGISHKSEIHQLQQNCWEFRLVNCRWNHIREHLKSLEWVWKWSYCNWLIILNTAPRFLDESLSRYSSNIEPWRRIDRFNDIMS
jgi:hypothetical protein